MQIHSPFNMLLFISHVGQSRIPPITNKITAVIYRNLRRSYDIWHRRRNWWLMNGLTTFGTGIHLMRRTPSIAYSKALAWKKAWTVPSLNNIFFFFPASWTHFSQKHVLIRQRKRQRKGETQKLRERQETETREERIWQCNGGCLIETYRIVYYN